MVNDSRPTPTIDYLPEWLTFELSEALGKLPSRKHRETVLRLAEARATGTRTEAETFRLPGVCSRVTWYGRYRQAGQKLPGWRDDPDVAAALEAATKRAQWWQDQADARRIAKRQEQLAQARDLLAEYAPHAVKRLFVLMGGAGNEETRRKAANDILDRADEETASKARAGLAVEVAPAPAGPTLREILEQRKAAEQPGPCPARSEPGGPDGDG